VLLSLEARPFLPYDLPLVRRLAAQGVSFDSEMTLTHGALSTLSGTLLSALFLSEGSSPIFILREGEAEYAAQFRHRSGDQHAHIGFIAPGLDQLYAEECWEALIDSMVWAAGKRGAHTLNAEVDENSHAFDVLRRSGFALYARQDLWLRPAAPLPDADPDLLRPAHEDDTFAVNALYSNIVPRMVLQADAPPDPSHGLIYEQAGRVVAFVSVTEGRNGIYLQPFLHPEMDHHAGALHAAALARMPRAERLPVYICVRRYQDWLRVPLLDMGFEPFMSQAVMVKHTVARVEHPALSTIPRLAGAVRVVPPIKMAG
jgi:hypothetical protein